MKRALVHDWLTTYAGSEKCVESIVHVWNDIDVFTLVDFLSDADRKSILQGKRATTSFIQNLPFSRSKFRGYLPFFPLAIENFDLADYDLIISSSHSVAKGVLTHSQQTHVCYCHTPMRYAWDLYHQYLREAKLQKGLKSILAKTILHYLRVWDYASSARVDHFIANSHYIARRIKKNYNREASVIYPPVNIEQFHLCTSKEDYYLTASRMVPYKRIDLIVEAFSAMPDKKLLVIGDGPDYKKIQAKAKKNVELLGYQPFESLKTYMQQAKAFIFAAEEDFGIVPVEAQACGTPVIAFGRGGTLETVISGKSGLFFEKQNANSLMDAVRKFDASQGNFDPVFIRSQVEKFSKERYEKEMKQFIDSLDIPDSKNR